MIRNSTPKNAISEKTNGCKKKLLMRSSLNSTTNITPTPVKIIPIKKYVVISASMFLTPFASITKVYSICASVQYHFVLCI